MKGRVIGGVGLLLSDGDNVMTAIAELPAGASVSADNGAIELIEPVSFGHKVALESIHRGGDIRKYGEVIAEATQDITTGEWVHTHNAESRRGRGDLSPGRDR
jgi:SAF domain.